MKAPDDDLAINCTAQLQLLEACRAVAPGITIVHAGTRQIYGRPRYLPVDEAHPLRPVDVNGVNKMAGEAYHLLFHDVYGIKTPRAAPDQRLRAGHADQGCAAELPRHLAAARARGQPFEVWGGEQRRDMLYIDDAVDAFLAAAVTPETAGLGAQCRRRRAVQPGARSPPR